MHYTTFDDHAQRLRKEIYRQQENTWLTMELINSSSTQPKRLTLISYFNLLFVLSHCRSNAVFISMGCLNLGEDGSEVRRVPYI